MVDHPDGTIYQHPAYVSALQRTYGYKIETLLCKDMDGKVSGVLPLMGTTGLLTGNGFTSLPRTLVSGPLAVDDNALDCLLGAAMNGVRAGSSTRLQIRTYDSRIQSRLSCAQHETTYVLELPRRVDDVRFGNSRNHGTIKWSVSKAHRSGVYVRQADSEADLRRWYQLYLETMRWHAAIPHPYREFQACWDILAPLGLMQLVLAERNEAGRPIMLAGSIFLRCGKTVFYHANARRKDSLSLRPNDAIHWSAIHAATAEGYRRYDFGAVVDSNEGLAHFKRKWGAKARWTYYWSYTPFAGEERARSKTVHMARAYAYDMWTHRQKMWRYLPLRVTAAMGNWMYGNL